jgi:hemerythrin-like metal-binding protein
MSLLKWKPSFSLGVHAVDLEHREMIGMINATYAHLEDENDPQQVEEALGEILAGISAHFALEERLMLNAAYGEYSDHKDSHEELLDDIRDLMDSYANDPVAGRELLSARLSSWFEKHFSTFDARLHGELG